MILKRIYYYIKTLYRFPRTLQTLFNAIKQLEQKQNASDDAIRQAAKKQITLDRLCDIQTFSLWIDQLAVPESLMISVVMATRNRAGILSRAIKSVLAQSYSKWELIIVDDGSVDHTQTILQTHSDPRIRVFKIIYSGLSAARNCGLDRVRGDAVVYLDDDNIMQPNWLKAVAWAFNHWSEVNVLLGARLIDDYNRVNDKNTPGFPWIHFEPFDYARLMRGNIADVGVFAHRSNISNIRFDENLNSLSDWDLLLQLSATEKPLELPIISIHYTTHCEDRLSNKIPEQEFIKIRQKWENGSGVKSFAN